MVEHLEKGNTANKNGSGSLIKRVAKWINKAIHGPSTEEIVKGNEEAWNKFPEDVKKEMSESLNMRDKIDLYGLDFSEIGELDVSKEGDIIKFKEGIEKKDSIGKYIEINGIKCRKHQHGISGFVYENIRTRHKPHQRLRVGFCEKGVRQDSVIIDYSFKAREA